MTSDDLPGPQALDLAAMVALADGCTCASVERGVAVLLGASEDAARGAVEALEAADVLGAGLALHAALHASRRGTDIAGAITDLAAGRPLPAQWSTFEHRAAREEIADELDLVRRSADAVGPPPQAAEGPVAVARALRAGHRVVEVADAARARADLAALVELRWVVGICRALGGTAAFAQAAHEALAAPVSGTRSVLRGAIPPGAPVTPMAADHVDLASFTAAG